MRALSALDFCHIFSSANASQWAQEDESKSAAPAGDLRHDIFTHDVIFVARDPQQVAPRHLARLTPHFPAGRAHSERVNRVSWAHPEFGQIVASCSHDKTVGVDSAVVACDSEEVSG